MRKPEWNSSAWREHNERVKLIEASRRADERKRGVKIGEAYIPPPAPIQPAVQMVPTEKAPAWPTQVIIGFLIVAAFLGVSYAF